MKWLFAAVVALLVSVTVALVALPDPGYVLIGYGKYSIETSLLVIVVLLGIAYAVLRLLSRIWKTPARIHHWGQKRRDQRLQVLFDQAMIDMTEGRLPKAERRLARLAHAGQLPLAASFSAARTANHLGHSEQRDQYLDQALRAHPDAEVAIGLTRTELQLKQNQLEQAQTGLTQLRALAPDNPQVLRLLMQFYLQQDDQGQLRELLPRLRQRDVLGTEQWQQLALRAYGEQIEQISADRGVDVLQNVWKGLPASVQQDDEMQALYIDHLIKLGAHRQAGRILSARLKESWNQKFVYLFGKLNGADTDQLQTTVENWLVKHPDDAVLLLTAGKISLRNQLWGKARSYLEASISLQPAPETYRLLGSLLEQLDEQQQAADCYRLGMALADAGSADEELPLLIAGSSEIQATAEINRSD